MDSYDVISDLGLIDIRDNSSLSNLDPDILFQLDPDFKTFTWSNVFAVQTKSNNSVTHRYLKYALKDGDEGFEIIPTNLPSPEYDIEGRFGHVESERGVSYPLITVWNDYRFSNDMKYYDVIESKLHSIFNYDRSKLIFCAGRDVIRLGNRKFPLQGGESDSIFDLRKQYHKETDPVKKRAIGVKLGIVPVKPDKIRPPVVGESKYYNRKEYDMITYNQYYLTEDMDRRGFLKMLGRGIWLTGLSPSSVAKIATNLSTPLPAKPADILGAFKTMYEMTDKFWTHNLTLDAAKDTLQKFNGSLLTLLGSINKEQRKHDSINYYERIIKQMQVREKQLLSYGSEGYIPNNFVSDFYDDDFFGEVVWHHSLLADLYKSGAITKDIEKYLITGLPSKYGITFYNAYQVIGSREYARTGEWPDNDEVTRILEKEYPDHVDPEEVERLNTREKYEKERLEQEEKNERSERGSRFDYAGGSEDVGYAKYYEKANLKFNDLVLMLENTEDDMFVKGIEMYGMLTEKLYFVFIGAEAIAATVIKNTLDGIDGHDRGHYAGIRTHFLKFTQAVLVNNKYMTPFEFKTYAAQYFLTNEVLHFHVKYSPYGGKPDLQTMYAGKDLDLLLSTVVGEIPSIRLFTNIPCEEIPTMNAIPVINDTGTIKLKYCFDWEISSFVDIYSSKSKRKLKICTINALLTHFYVTERGISLKFTTRQIVDIIENVVNNKQSICIGDYIIKHVPDFNEEI